MATGAACAARWEDAVLSGLLETIERDAFTIHWENRWPARIRPLPQDVLELGSRLEQRGFDLRVGQLATSDGHLSGPLAA